MPPITTGKAIFIGFVVHNDANAGRTGGRRGSKQSPEQAIHEITGLVDRVGTGQIFFVYEGGSDKNDLPNTVRRKVGLDRGK